MKRTLMAVAAVSALGMLAPAGASAGVELGAPDHSNYLAPYGWGTCDWWTSAWLRACPGVLSAPVAAPAPVGAPAVVKAKKAKAAK